MDDPIPDGWGLADGLGPATVVAILVLGSALSIYVWRDLKLQWDTQIEATIDSFTGRLGTSIDEEVDGLYAELRRRSRLWDGPALENPMWEEDAEAFLADNLAVLAVVRSDQSWKLAAPAPQTKRALAEAFPELRRLQADTHGDFVSDPIRLPSGAIVLGMQVAVPADEGEESASLLALIDPGRLIEQAVGTPPPAYGITVKSGTELLYQRSPQGVALTEWRKSRRVSLPLGRDWILETVPSSESVATPGSQGPVIALVGGLLASALMAASLHFGTLAGRRERALRLVNANLAARVGESLRGQDELRTLSLELETRVAERTAELADTIVELETFNYSVSHDLRGPLGAIINFAAILKEDCGDRLGADAEHLDRIVTSATAAVSMMDALLAYSRSGRTELCRARLAMRPLVQEVVADLAASSPGLDCSVTLGDLPDAFADESMTRVALTNLIGNAFKFVPHGEKPVVEIGGHVEGEEVAYFVRDHGVGFDMRFADKLFKVFERLHTSADGYEGHGIGLAIVARVVRRNGGRIWAQSAPGRGATFSFTLPRAPDEASPREHGRSES